MFEELFNREKPITYILVKSDDDGLKTYLNPIISSFNKAYKDQLISFLKEIVKQLEQKEVNKNARS